MERRRWVTLSIYSATKVGVVIHITCQALKAFSFADLHGHPFLHLQMKDERATEQQVAQPAGESARDGIQPGAPAQPRVLHPQAIGSAHEVAVMPATP